MTWATTPKNVSTTLVETNPIYIGSSVYSDLIHLVLIEYSPELLTGALRGQRCLTQVGPRYSKSW